MDLDHVRNFIEEHCIVDPTQSQLRTSYSELHQKYLAVGGTLGKKSFCATVRDLYYPSGYKGVHTSIGTAFGGLWLKEKELPVDHRRKYATAEEAQEAARERTRQYNAQRRQQKPVTAAVKGHPVQKVQVSPHPAVSETVQTVPVSVFTNLKPPKVVSWQDQTEWNVAEVEYQNQLISLEELLSALEKDLKLMEECSKQGKRDSVLDREIDTVTNKLRAYKETQQPVPVPPPILRIIDSPPATSPISVSPVAPLEIVPPPMQPKVSFAPISIPTSGPAKKNHRSFSQIQKAIERYEEEEQTPPSDLIDELLALQPKIKLSQRCDYNEYCAMIIDSYRT